jgi:steroid delta-isomerase-like uncharacterized protein
LEQIAQTWVGLFTSQGSSALDDIAAPDVTHESASVGSVAGRDNLAASQQAVRDAFPDLQATVNLVLTDAPDVVVQWTATGTQTGAFQDQAATGNVATWDGNSLLRIECGQITQSWTYLDQLSRLQQSQAAAMGTPAAGADVAAAATPASCPPLTDEAAGQLLDAWWGEAWAVNVAVLETLTTEDVAHHWAEGPDSTGQAAQHERIAGLTTSLSAVRYAYEDFVVDGDYIAAVWQASDGTITFDGLNIFRIECGQIAEVWSEMDLLSLREQLAALAASPVP